MTHNRKVREFAVDELSDSELKKVSGGERLDYKVCTEALRAQRAVDAWNNLLGAYGAPATIQAG